MVLKLIAFILGLLSLIAGLCIPMQHNSKDKIIWAIILTLLAFYLIWLSIS